MSRYVGLFALCFVVPFCGEARAVSKQVEDACRGDYHKLCSAYSVGTEELRSCMRKAQDQLSHRCAKALADFGEATPEEVRRYKARQNK